MSLTDKSQIFNIWKIRADVQSASSVMSLSKRKGISLSKTLRQNTEERSRSFIKLSARTKDKNLIQKRQIKLIVKPKPEASQHLICKIQKQNDINHQNKKTIFADSDCGYQQILKKDKRAAQIQSIKSSNSNSLRTKQINLSKREGIDQRQSNKLLYLRL